MAAVSRPQTKRYLGGAQVSERNCVCVYWGALLAYLGVTLCIGFATALQDENLVPGREWLYRGMIGLGAIAILVGTVYCLVRVAADRRERALLSE